MRHGGCIVVFHKVNKHLLSFHVAEGFYIGFFDIDQPRLEFLNNASQRRICYATLLTASLVKILRGGGEEEEEERRWAGAEKRMASVLTPLHEWFHACPIHRLRRLVSTFCAFWRISKREMDEKGFYQSFVVLSPLTFCAFCYPSCVSCDDDVPVNLHRKNWMKRWTAIDAVFYKKTRLISQGDVTRMFVVIGMERTYLWEEWWWWWRLLLDRWWRSGESCLRDERSGDSYLRDERSDDRRRLFASSSCATICIDKTLLVENKGKRERERKRGGKAEGRRKVSPPKNEKRHTAGGLCFFSGFLLWCKRWLHR